MALSHSTVDQHGHGQNGHSPLDTIMSFVGSITGGFAHFFTSLDHSIAAARAMERLAMTSDEVLAARGLTREEAHKQIITSLG